MTVDLTSYLKTCRRSHPHEEMDDVCERYTEYERELASLRAELALTTGTLEIRERNIETLNATIADMEVRHAAVMLHAQTHADEYNALRAEKERLEETQRKFGLWQHELMQRAERAEAERDANHQAWQEMQSTLEKTRDERDAALKDAESAKAALKAQAAEAYADVDEWAAYASEYFRAKWDLHGTLQKWRDRFDPDAARRSEQ